VAAIVGAAGAIGYTNPILPVSVKVDDLRHHTLVCGATGYNVTPEKTHAVVLVLAAGELTEVIGSVQVCRDPE
jgi:hypothetical protein